METFPENIVDSQEHKQIIKQINPDFSTELKMKAPVLKMLEGKKRRAQSAARWIDSITVAMSALLEDLKKQVRDHHGGNLSMCP